MLLCCLAIGALFIIAANDGSTTATGGRPTTGAPTTRGGAPLPAAPARPTAGEIGTPVTDGVLQFTVVAVNCGLSEVGTQERHATADGQFCVVNLTVRNVGTESRLFSDVFQRAFDTKDTEYRADSLAGGYANRGHRAFFTKVNPGDQLSGSIVFDIPKDTTLKRVELHDSPASTGVSVAVS
ncbi:DUF4352 domain-containing protein [Luedemannella flava]